MNGERGEFRGVGSALEKYIMKAICSVKDGVKKRGMAIAKHS